MDGRKGGREGGSDGGARAEPGNQIVIYNGQCCML